MRHLDSTKLVPFKKRDDTYHLPGLAKEAEEQIIDQVDPELRPEEQGFVRHLLAYADVLLKKAESEGQELKEQKSASAGNGNLREMPRRRRDLKDAA